MRSIRLGAPSLTGRNASELIDEAFGDLEFPMTAKVTNLVAHGLNFPEVNNLHMTGCTDAQNSVAVVEINSLAALHRLASSIEQVAGLYGHAVMLVIEAVAEDEDETGAYVIEQEALLGDVVESAIDPEIVVEEPVKKAVPVKKGK